MSTKGMTKQYWPNSAEMVTRRANEENLKRLDEKTIKEINSRLEQTADPIFMEPRECYDGLMNWQKEVMGLNRN